MNMIRVITFVIVLASIGGASFLESPESIHARERMERRQYASLPTGFSLSFPSAFDAWANDHFGFRTALISLQSFVHTRLLGELPNSRYIKGKDGWFFRGLGRQRGAAGGDEEYNEILDYTGHARFSEKEVRDWGKRLAERKRIVESRGGIYLFGVGPRKSTIYPEYLPSLLARHPGETRLQQLEGRVRGKLPAIYVDLPSELREAKKVGAYPRLYYRTDAHWNYYGAFFAYTAYMKKASERIPELSPVALSDFRIGEREDWYHRGFLSETRLLERESFPIFYPRKDSVYGQVFVINSKEGFLEEGNDDIASGAKLPLPEVGIGVADMPIHRLQFLGKKRSGGCRYLKNEAPNRPLTDIILLGDSFLQKAAPFFAAHATHTYFCRQTAAMSLPIFDKNRNERIRTELVVQELTEAYLGRE